MVFVKVHFYRLSYFVSPVIFFDIVREVTNYFLTVLTPLYIRSFTDAFSLY